jgi:hypothetical protein
MKIAQKRLSTLTLFAFGDTELTYSFEQHGSALESVVDYLHLSRSRHYTATRDWRRFQLGALLVIAGCLAIVAHARLAGFNPLAVICLAPGIIYLCLFMARQGHFLVAQGGDEQLWIIDDGSRRAIVAELDRRRRQRLLDIYGQLNLANEPYLEIRKIEWLVEESVLTRDQADDQIRMVNGVAVARAQATDGSREPGESGFFDLEAVAV